jgi:hypothetical protein
VQIERIEHKIAGQKMDRLLYFYGVVKDNYAEAVEGAVVTVIARFAGETEKMLGSTFTDREGAYFISIPKLPDYQGLIGFKVRAGKAHILLDGIDYPGNLMEHTEEERIPEQEEILGGQMLGPLTEHNVDEDNVLTVTLSPVKVNSLPVIVSPTIQTDAPTDVGMNSVTLHGRITNTSWENCDQRKFRIRAHGSDNWTDAGTETGSFGPEPFSFTISGLSTGTAYEFKALAHNLAGWGEGSVMTVTTTTLPEAPAELTADKPGSSKRKREALPKDTSYKAYRSTYWNWLKR